MLKSIDHRRSDQGAMDGHYHHEHIYIYYYMIKAIQATYGIKQRIREQWIGMSIVAGA